MTTVIISCDKHLRPHRIGSYVREADGWREDPVWTARLKKELAAWDASHPAPSLADLLERPRGDANHGATEHLIGNQPLNAQHALGHVGRDGDFAPRVMHSNQCDRCRDNAPIPDDRMQRLLSGFSAAGVGDVSLALLRSGDDRLRASLDRE